MSVNPFHHPDIPGQWLMSAFARTTGPFEPHAQNPVLAPELFSLPWGIPQAQIMYLFRTHGARTRLTHDNMEALFIYRIPPASERERAGVVLWSSGATDHQACMESTA